MNCSSLQKPLPQFNVVNSQKASTMFSKGTDSKIKGISDKKWYDIVILMAMWQQVCHVDFLACVNSEEYIFDFLHCLGFPFVPYSWGMNLIFV